VKSSPAPFKSPEKVYGLHFSEEEIANAIRGRRLLTLDVETSRVCNLRCVYCYSSAGRKRKNELSIDELRGVVDQAVDLGAKVVTVIGGGEPLLYPQLRELVAHIASRGVLQNVFTNGTRVTPEWARFFAGHKVSMVVKFNSLRDEVQDALSGRPGTAARIRRGLQALTDCGYGRDPDLPLGVETIICRQNYDEIETMWRHARDRNWRPYFEVITFQGRAKREELNVTKAELKRIFDRLLAIDEKEYGFTWAAHPPIAGLSCQRHFYNILVTANGYVQPCTGVDIRVGNVRHESLREILDTSPVIAAARDMKALIKEPCRGCAHSAECYGCRGFAYHYCGDFLAADPTCWVPTETRKRK
jgi:radical SAM protein with 4Fe4S-binding SPASM domain